MTIEEIAALIRDVPDFPKPGILFKDITPLLDHAAGFAALIDIWTERYADQNINKVAGIESRGFIFAAALAPRLDAGLVLVRKPGKLPWKTHGLDYELEYGTDRLEVHQDAVADGDRVLLVDDLLATGGTAAAAAELLKMVGGNLVEASFLIELSFLNGRDKLGDVPIQSFITY